tara:strand:- start:139 stop:2535 length:2397 start_codon:yes stop_codon:yes gene_type:complete
MRRSQLARKRGESQRAEIELVMMGPSVFRTSIEDAASFGSGVASHPMMKQKKRRTRRKKRKQSLPPSDSNASSQEEDNDGFASNAALQPGIDLSLAEQAPRTRVGSSANLDTVVVNKRGRLSTLFSERKGTIYEAWEMDALALAEELEDQEQAQTLEELNKAAGRGSILKGSKGGKMSCCCAKKKKKKSGKSGKKKKPVKTAKDYAELVIGTMRKGLIATTIMLHPLIVNTALTQVYCTAHPLTGELVLATQPGTQCFVGMHWVVFSLAICALAVESVLLPLFVIFALSNSTKICCRATEKEEGGDDAQLVLFAEKEEAAATKFGNVHGGACCKCVCCIEILLNARRNFLRNHDKDAHRVRNLSYSAFTFNDYKPEFFFIRLMFVVGITVIAVCNNFLDPLNLLVIPAGLTAKQALILGAVMQATRFVLCVTVLVAPTVVLMMLLPNKNGSRWKMPLRLAFAMLNLGMLSLNMFSWTVGQYGETASSGLRFANVVLSFIVLCMSLSALALMAICFVVFVVFRGAKRESVEIALNEAESESEELCMLARAVVESNQMNRAFLAWRKQTSGRTLAITKSTHALFAKAAVRPAIPQIHASAWTDDAPESAGVVRVLSVSAVASVNADGSPRRVVKESGLQKKMSRRELRKVERREKRDAAEEAEIQASIVAGGSRSRSRSPRRGGGDVGLDAATRKARRAARGMVREAGSPLDEGESSPSSSLPELTFEERSAQRAERKAQRGAAKVAEQRVQRSPRRGAAQVADLDAQSRGARRAERGRKAAARVKGEENAHDASASEDY